MDRTKAARRRPQVVAKAAGKRTGAMFATAYMGRKRRATRISCHGAPPTSACAAFITESRMEFANANKVYRKSGGSPPISSPRAATAVCSVESRRDGLIIAQHAVLGSEENVNQPAPACRGSRKGRLNYGRIACAVRDFLKSSAELTRS
jgi:hypothetical protein